MLTKRENECITKVYTFVTSLLGELQLKRVFKKDTEIVFFSGLRYMNQFMYSRGDCCRFAKILYDNFPQYDPQIVLIRYREHKERMRFYGGEEALNWDHAYCKMLDDFYIDAFGIHSGYRVVHIADDTGPMVVRNLESKLLNGNFSTMRFIYDGVVKKSVPHYVIRFNMQDPLHPDIDGAHFNWIDKVKDIYAKIHEHSVEKTCHELEMCRSDMEHFSTMKFSGGVIAWNRFEMLIEKSK